MAGKARADNEHIGVHMPMTRAASEFAGKLLERVPFRHV
jgi:hypothetical protein